MRLIKNFEIEDLARKFSLFLRNQMIDNNLDVSFDENSKTFNYQVWIIDEDQVQLATEFLSEFEKNPNSAKFKFSFNELYPEQKEIVIEEKRSRHFSFTLTYFFLCLCVIIYFINLFQESKIQKEHPNKNFTYLTPVQSLLMFDRPTVLLKLNEIVIENNIDPEKMDKVPPAAKKKIKELDELPQWVGLYDLFFLKRKNNTIHPPQIVLFESIKKGELWRLFTPSILHLDFLHILFNMMWLIFLGKQIEQRISKFKYLLLILMLGIISNSFQYLMSGPYFLGFSGIVMGMVGFIWSRQKIAPWEGYPTQKSIFLFLGVYVILMFVLSLSSFITKSLDVDIMVPSIANTGHVIGAISGFLFGRSSFFSWRPRHER